MTLPAQLQADSLVFRVSFAIDKHRRLRVSAAGGLIASSGFPRRGGRGTSFEHDFIRAGESV